jgi:hypothetical protein
MKLNLSQLSIKGLALVICFGIFTPESAAIPPVRGATPSGETIVRWSENIFALLTTLDSGAPAGLRLNRELAMVHIAMHDAANAVDEKFERYALDIEDRYADPALAAAAAAHAAVVIFRPAKADQADAFLLIDLDRVTAPNKRRRSLALGAAAAQAIIALREDDGFFHSVPYTFGPPDPSVYQPVPPGGTNVIGTQLPSTIPFGLKSGSQFRSPPPPDLSSAQWLANYNETKDFGRSDSKVRTADQTAAVHFWSHQTQFVWNDIARLVATQNDKGLWKTARAFALVNMGLMDGLIAVFDTKYHYNYWRPYTAIREIDDGRIDTVMDPAWTPLLNTPPYPEHNSAQAGSAAAAAYMLNKFYGENVGFTITTATAQPPGSTRTFSNFDAAVVEGALSRIWAGIHFRSATDTAAQNQGKSVGAFLYRHYLQKMDDDRDRCRKGKDHEHRKCKKHG